MGTELASLITTVWVGQGGGALNEVEWQLPVPWPSF